MSLHLRAMDAIHAAVPGAIFFVEVRARMPALAAVCDRRNELTRSADVVPVRVGWSG